MANKTWNYVVALHSPEEISKTPAQRDISYAYTTATSAKRAISKIEKDAAAQAGWSRKDYEIIEAYIDRDEHRNAPEFPWNAEGDDD